MTGVVGYTGSLKTIIDAKAPKVDTSSIGYDVVVIAGQSNAVGNGNDAASPVIDPTEGRIRVYAPGGTYANQLVVASDPLTHRSGPAVNVGPGMEFARWYVASTPARRVLLVPVAYNGTAILSGTPRWDPTTAWPNDAANLYNLAIAQTQAALTAAGGNSKVVAVLWVQGETDALAGTTGTAYRTGFEQLIDGFRSRLGDPNLPFIVGSMLPEFVSNPSGAPTRAAIHAVHAATPTRKPYTAFVQGPTGYDRGDATHYLAEGCRQLGRGMAAAYATALANSSPASAVAANPPTAPAPALTNTGLPMISGSATVGQVLAVTTGTWSPIPDSYTYQWNRAGAAISGATAATYTIASGDSGKAITATVTAVKAGYASTAATSSSVTVASTAAAVTDTFNRADTTAGLGTTETGSKTWTSLSGTFGITGGQAYNASNVSGAMVAVDMGNANHYVQGRVTAGDGGTALLLRVSDASNWVGIIVPADGATVAPYHMVGGGASPIGASLAGAFGDTWKLTANGTTITVYRNGTQVTSFTDTNPVQGSKVGLTSASNVARFDDFVADLT